MKHLPEPYDELASAVARVHQTMLADAREIKVLREQLTDMSLRLMEANDKLTALARKHPQEFTEVRGPVLATRKVEEHAKLNLSSLDMQRF